MLIQSILRFYGEELGAKTIAAKESQTLETLHAMLVKNDGSIQNFGDAIIASLIDDGVDQREFEAEELRKYLIKKEMIQGGELKGGGCRKFYPATIALLGMLLARMLRLSWNELENARYGPSRRKKDLEKRSH